jgi:fructuronate reductase
LLAVTEIFGTDLPADAAVRGAVTGHLAALFEKGAAATIAARP